MHASLGAGDLHCGAKGLPQRLHQGIAALLVATAYLFIVVPKGFLPSEDQGRFNVNTEGAPGISFDEMVRHQLQVADVLLKDTAADIKAGRTICLVGDSGIGKSRLVEVLRERVISQGATRLVFRCSHYHLQSALYPVIEHLQRFLHWDSADAPEARLEALEQALVSGGFFTNPQVTVAIEQYRSQKIHIVGEVRTPGSYALSGDMRLVEALALAGSSTAMASGEVLVVHESTESQRVDLRELENGDLSQNVRLMNGDTIFVQRAESVYVFGQVRNPGAYPIRQKKTTVLQALSLAGGMTDRGSTSRIQIVRIVDGEKKEIRVELDDLVEPRDSIIVPERFF